MKTARRVTPSLPRRARAVLLLLLMSACSANYPATRLTPSLRAGAAHDAFFALPDGTRLPYRSWLPRGAPHAVVLALHGFNDSADAWELPGPALAAHGIAVFAPDQRGFGATLQRGRWPGTASLVADAIAITSQLSRRYPGTKLYLMGESMGGAVLMVMAADPRAPKVAGYIFSSPAVWGWSELNLVYRAALWLTNGIAPGLVLGNGPVRVTASDNRDALIRLGEDPRTILRTRVAAVKGLVDLMDRALHAAPGIETPSLYLYGGNDELVPKHAMRAAWREAAKTGKATLAYYPGGYHLLLRDLGRSVPIADILAWIANPTAPLPSGAERQAALFLAGQEGRSGVLPETQPGARPPAGAGTEPRPSSRLQSALALMHRTRSSAG